MDAIAEQVTRKQAIAEVMQMHGLDHVTAAALVDEMLRLTEKRLQNLTHPIGLTNGHKEIS